MFSFGEYYLQRPITNIDLNWNPYPINFDLNNSFNLPPLLTYGVPRYDSNNFNVFAFTPPIEYGYIPQTNYNSQQNTYNPFVFLEPKNTNVGAGFTNPFAFLNPTQTYSSQGFDNPFAFLNTRSTATSKTSTKNKTRKIGKRVAEEILPGKEVLKIGNGVNLSSLNRDLKVKLVRLSEKAKELGYTLVVSDGYRTHEQQIAAKRNKPRLAATPGKSPHEYGAGIDIALYDRNGNQVNIANVPQFTDFAKTIGLSWGNDWKSKKEPWHFELANWRTRSDIGPEYRRRNSSIA